MIRMSWGAGIVGNQQKEPPNDFVDKVLALWDQGCDTWQIHFFTHQPQATCERALHAGLEGRRKITWQQICSKKESREEGRRAEEEGHDEEEDRGPEIRKVPHEPD